MLKPKVSIVIPVYNVSRYLEKCLNSVTQQTLSEIEIIIVNDCSPDPLDEVICQNFADRDERIVYVKHGENLGLGAARNTGINLATTHYIGFVDSDDYVHPELFEITYREATENNRDIVVFGFDWVNEDNEQMETFIFQGNTNGDLLKNYLDYKNSMDSGVCNKLWKKSLFLDNNIKFPTQVFFEDEMTTPRLLYFANNITFLKQSLYYYLQRDQSIMHSFSKKHINDLLTTYVCLFEFVTSVNKLDRYQKSLDNRLWSMIRYHLKMGLSKSNHDEKTKLLAYLADKVHSENIPHAQCYFPHRYY